MRRHRTGRRAFFGKQIGNPPHPRRASRRDEHAEVLPLLIIWPAAMVLLLLLGAQALLVSGARAHAEAAASEGLRAMWADAATTGLGLAAGENAHEHRRASAASMAVAAHDAVAATAAAGEGWRWWTPGSAVVRSDWCSPDAGLRPGPAEPGWARVEVTGEVFGPFSALWPGRFDTVHASASGPVVLSAIGSDGTGPPSFGPPAELPVC